MSKKNGMAEVESLRVANGEMARALQFYGLHKNWLRREGNPRFGKKSWSPSLAEDDGGAQARAALAESRRLR